uniref:hypothetical protein n=1 Tax=Bacillus nitratireducens TaxID=2026193 RepID=UPI001C92DB3E
RWEGEGVEERKGYDADEAAKQMKIGGQEVAIDKFEEKEGLVVRKKERVRANKLHSCSRFRSERGP